MAEPLSHDGFNQFNLRPLWVPDDGAVKWRSASRRARSRPNRASMREFSLTSSDCLVAISLNNCEWLNRASASESLSKIELLTETCVEETSLERFERES